MTELLYQMNPYEKAAEGVVHAYGPNGGVVLDSTIFYPTGGGQPGDTGVLEWAQRSSVVTDSRKAEAGVELICAADGEKPSVGETIRQVLDWERRHRHMRMHTALHLLSVVIPLPVTGGSIGAEKSRLDFDMPDAIADKNQIEDALNRLVSNNLEVTDEWITDAELESNPGLVKTMSVQPPKGAGKVRLVRIGTSDQTIDLQPCGGTHVARTSEIGTVRLGKVEKKGRRNRRVNIVLD